MEDRVKLTADDSDYQAVMRRAGNTADQFTSRIARAQTGFTQLFRRTPERRAELALSNLAGSLAGGDIAGAVTGFAARITGLGLGIGVAVGAGVEIFAKFKAQVEAADSAVEKIRSHLGTALPKASLEGIKLDLGTSIKNEAEVTKSSQTFGARIRQAFRDEGKNNLFDAGVTSAGLERKDAGNPELKAASAERKRQRDDVSSLASLELAIVDARRLGLQVGEREGKLAELKLKFAERLEKLQNESGLNKPGRDATQLFRRMAAIKEDDKLSRDEIDKSEQLREASLAMEEKIARLQHNGLAGEDLKRVRAGFEIESLDQQIASETSPQAKRGLQLKRLQKVNEARGFLAPAGPSNPFPFGTTASRGFESQFGAGGFNRRGIEDSLGFGGLARASIARGESLTPEQALLKIGTSADDIAGYRKNAGELTGGKGGSPDVVAAIERFANVIEQAFR